MIANYRYLHASLFSFFIHAAIFLYIYGTFDTNASQTPLISKPLQIELRFDLPPQDAKKQTPVSKNTDATNTKLVTADTVYSKVKNEIQIEQNSSLFQSSIADLLLEESEIKT